MPAKASKGFAAILLLFSMLLGASLSGGQESQLLWSRNLSSTPATYSPTAESTFEITWTGNVSHVWFEGNFSGIVQTHPMIEAVLSDSFQLGSDTDFLEKGEQLDMVGKTTLTDDDLAALTGGTLMNAKGTFLYLETLTVATQAAPDFTINPDDITDTPGWYLKFDTGSQIYRYRSIFTPAFKSDINTSTVPNVLTDYINQNFSILGQDYTIVNATWLQGDITLELRGGINNDSISLQDTNVSSSSSGGRPAYVNSNTVSDVSVEIRGSNTSDQLSMDYFALTWTADEDMYVPLGDNLGESAYIDDNQMFLNFDIWFNGIRESESENITLTPSANQNDEFDLNFVNKAGTQLTVPLLDVDDTTLRHGEETYGLVIKEGNLTTWADAGIIDRNDYFVISDSSAKNTYLMRYKSLDATSDMLEFEDVGSDSEVKVSYTFTNNQTGAGNLTRGGKDYRVYIYGDLNNADIIVDLDGNGTIKSGEIPYWYTKYGAYILVGSMPGNGIKFFSEGGNDIIGARGPTDAFTVTFTTPAADQVDLSAISGNVTLITIADTNNKEDYSARGTHVYQSYSGSGPDTLTITYPHNQTEMLVDYTYSHGKPNGTYSLTLTGLPVGTHTWRSHANDTGGNLYATEWYAFNISKATPTMSLTFDDRGGDVTVEKNTSLLVNGNLITGDRGTILTLLIEGVEQFSAVSIANLATFPNQGSYNVSLNYPMTQNYTAGSVSYWVTVTNESVGRLGMTIKNPANGATFNETDFTLTVDTNESAVCWYGIDEGASILIPKTTDYLPRLGEPINSVKSLSTDSDLMFLDEGYVSNAKGTFTYSQTLYWPPAAMIAENSNYSLRFSPGENAYEYRLVFTPAFESDIDSSNDLDDFDKKSITILDKTYTVVDTNCPVTGSCTIDLMAGSAGDTLNVGELRTYTVDGTDYVVTLSYTDGIYAKFVVNGVSTSSMRVGESDVLADGSEIGVADILYQNYAGGVQQVEFYVGARKLRLQDSNVTDDAASHNLMKGNNVADDAYVKIRGSIESRVFSLNEIRIYWQPNQIITVPMGERLSTFAIDDQMLRNLDLAFFDYIPEQRLKICLGHSSMSYSSGSVEGDADCLGLTTITNHTGHNVTVSVSGEGTHTLNIRCRNAAAASASTSLSFTYAPPADEPPSDDGDDVGNEQPQTNTGGGGGGAPAPTNTGPTTTKVISSVSKTKGIDMSISKDEIPVNGIAITVSESATNVEITVSATDERPESVAELPGDDGDTTPRVYKYLEIEHKNLEGKIKEATIEFKVPKAWLTDNSHEKGQIVLQHYTGIGWEELPTEIIEETAINVYYAATTPGFSVFAISVKEETISVKETVVEEPGPIELEPVAEGVPEEPAPETSEITGMAVADTGSSPRVGIQLLLLVFLVGLVVVGLIVPKARKSKAKKTPARRKTKKQNR